MPWKIHFWVFLAGLCLWGLILYSQTFKAPFIFDDEEFILKNPAIRQLGDPALWQDPNCRKRLIAFYSFALNYHFHGTDVAGYHAVNIAIHLLAGLCVVWLVLLLLGTPRMRDDALQRHGNAAALFCGGLFLSHPIQTQAVTYISQRFESLAALFYLGSVCAYLAARIAPPKTPKRMLFFLLSAVSGILGMFTKEIVFTLPLAFLLIESVFFADPSGKAAAAGTRPGKHWIVIGTVFFSGVLLASVFKLDLRRILSEHEKMGFSSFPYFLTQFRVLTKYFQLLILPLQQNFDYDFPLSLTLFEPATFLSAALVAAIFMLGFLLLKRFPLPGFGILWFFLVLSVTSSFIPLTDVICEHRLYLPMAGFSIVLCSGLYYGLKNFRVSTIILAALILAFSLATFRRNAIWRDEVVFWEDVVSKSPRKARPHSNLGRAYRQKGEYQKAIIAYEAALRLHSGPDRRSLSKIYTNLGAVYGAIEQYPEEIRFSLKAIETQPQNVQAHSNLGFAYAAVGDYDKALTYGQKAVRLAPRFGEAWNNLGVTCGRMGQLSEAIEYFKKALVLEPGNAEAEANLRRAQSMMRK